MSDESLGTYLECIKKAQHSFKTGDHMRAIHWAQKAQRIYPKRADEAALLVSSFMAATSPPPDCGRRQTHNPRMRSKRPAPPPPPKSGASPVNGNGGATLRQAPGRPATTLRSVPGKRAESFSPQLGRGSRGRSESPTVKTSGGLEGPPLRPVPPQPFTPLSSKLPDSRCNTIGSERSMSSIRHSNSQSQESLSEHQSPVKPDGDHNQKGKQSDTTGTEQKLTELNLRKDLPKAEQSEEYDEVYNPEEDVSVEDSKEESVQKNDTAPQPAEETVRSENQTNESTTPTNDQPSQDDSKPAKTPQDSSPTGLQITRIQNLTTVYEQKLSEHVSRPFLYEALELDTDNYSQLSTSKIKKQFHKLSRIVHPDKASAELHDDAAACFKFLRDAYETLIDESQREQYHYMLANPEKVQEREQASDPRPTNVESYTRADGLIYSGEINFQGQAHGYGEMQYDPRRHDFSFAEERVDPDSAESDKDAAVVSKIPLTLPSHPLAVADCQATRSVAANFENDVIVGDDIRIDFIIPKTEDGAQEAYYKGTYLLTSTNFILRHGKGIMHYPDGSSYHGFWSHDLWQDTRASHLATSVLKHKGTGTYTGGFKSGRYNGQGMLQLFKGCAAKSSGKLPASYVGGFSDGKYHGYGTFEDPLQNFRGVYCDGARSGPGHLKVLDEQGKITREVRGAWKDDRVHGQNIEVLVPGYGIFRGEYSNGEKGKGVTQRFGR